jgi:hypothetical protein
MNILLFFVGCLYVIAWCAGYVGLVKYDPTMILIGGAAIILSIFCSMIRLWED